MFLRIFMLIPVALALSGCEKIALLTTPKKQPIESNSPLATTAENNFWETLHKGRYNNIPATTKLLMAAYLENPNDPKLAAHLGFMHMWEITERQRRKQSDPAIVNNIILATKYFSDAIELNPHDARTQGFLGDSMLAEGNIFHDQRQQVRGYFQLMRAIHMWPEFNYFTAGYIMSTLDPQSAQFKEALAWQWKTMDLCAGTSINKNNPDFSPYLSRETQKGPQRACWNSWIAPHNFEGFFLNMGDMLVKQGNWQTAVSIYSNAKLSKTYTTWPYRKLLEDRIANAKTNVAVFQKQDGTSPAKRIMINSGYGCVMCHQT